MKILQWMNIYPCGRVDHLLELYLMLRESETGYLSSFIIYTGSSTYYSQIADNMFPKSWAQYKSLSKVVLSRLKSFLNQGYILTLDNYCTSPELANALLNLQTDSLGTLEKKEGLPKTFWKWNQIKEASLRNNFVGTC